LRKSKLAEEMCARLGETKDEDPHRNKTT